MSASADDPSHLPPGDLLDLIAAAASRPGSRCRMGIVLGQLPGDAASAIRAALGGDQKVYQHQAIAKVLQERFGVYVSPLTVGRHRNHECKCDE